MKMTKSNRKTMSKVGLGISLIVMVFFSTLMGGCNRHPSALVGIWKNRMQALHEKDDSPNYLVLFKDGTGIIAGKNVTWKVEKNRLFYTSPTQGWFASYKLSDSKLTIINLQPSMDLSRSGELTYVKDEEP